MSTPNAEPVRVEELTAILRDGVRLLRKTYSSKADFAYNAGRWVERAEAVLNRKPAQIDETKS